MRLHTQPTNKRKTPTPDRRYWIVLSIFVLTFVAYWPALHAGFVWDDDSMLTDNRLIKLPDGLYYIWFTTAPVDYFPLTYSSLWLEWRLWGLNPLGYHAVNIFLHAASCVVLWQVLKRLKVPGAWLAAMLFAVHPVTVESVAWIAERKNVLAMFFFMLSAWTFLLFEDTKHRRFYLLSLVAFVLSLLAKPSAATWPAAMLLILWWRRADIRRAIWTIPFLALSIGFGLVTIWFQNHRAIAGDFVRDHGFATRLTAAASNVWFYIYKALLPIKLSFVYPEWSLNPRSAIAWLPLLALVLVIAIGWIFRERWGRSRLLSFGCFVLLLAPVLGFFDIYFQRYSPVADHWQYFALPSIVALVVAGLVRFKAHKVVGPILIAVCLGLTFAQAKVYQNSQTLWSDTLNKNSRCWLACNNLGLILQNNGSVDGAVTLYKKSLELKPDQVEAHNNWGSAFFDAGKFDEAMEHYRAAFLINSNSAVTHYNIGNVHDRQGRTAEAIAEFREAIRLKSDYAQALNNLACILALQGKAAEAVPYLTQAVEYAPDYVDALSNLGSVLNRQNQPQQALAPLQRAVSLNRSNSDAHLNVGDSLFALQRYDEALSEFRTALALNPNQFLARYGEGNVLLRAGKTVEAEKCFSDVLAHIPTHAESHYQLALISQLRKDRKASIEHLREAVRLNPDWIEALNNLAWAIATDDNCKATEAQQAIRFAEHAVQLTHGANANAFDTLAAAWARNEVFSEAVKNGEVALQLAVGHRDTNMVSQIEKRLELYRSRLAYKEP